MSLVDEIKAADERRRADCRAVWERMTEAERGVRRLFGASDPVGYADRTLCASPADGAYGLAAWVFVIEGSPPPLGVLLVEAGMGHTGHMYLIGPSRRIRSIDDDEKNAEARKSIDAYLREIGAEG